MDFTFTEEQETISKLAQLAHLGSTYPEGRL